MLGNSAVAFAVVVRTRPRAIPLAMITMRKSTGGFPSLSYTCTSMGLSWPPSDGSLCKLSLSWTSCMVYTVDVIRGCSCSIIPFVTVFWCSAEVAQIRDGPLEK